MKNVNTPVGRVGNILALIAFALGGSVSAHAAQVRGYVCGTTDRELMVRVYEILNGATSPKGRVMALVDPTAHANQQLIGAIRETDLTPTTNGIEYEANAVHAIPGPVPYIDGVPLREIQWVVLGIQLSPNTSSQNRGIIPGILKIQRANGQIAQKPVTCTSY